MDQTNLPQNLTQRNEENYFTTAELCEASGISLQILNEAILDSEPSTAVPCESNTPHVQVDAETLNLLSTSPAIKRKQRNRTGWKSEVEKGKRMKGQQYLGYEKVDGNKRQLVKQKSQRVLGSPCVSKNCKRTKLRACGELPQTVRQQIFDEFWNRMDWSAKKAFVRNLVDQRSPRYPRKSSVSPKKEVINYYHLKVGGVRRPVCKAMFLSTLGLKEKQLRLWLTHKATTKRDKKTVTTTGKDVTAREFLTNLPKLPSHYCRTGTSKFFLEPIFTTKMEVYRQYQLYCQQHDKHSISRNLFCTIFRELNLSLFQPKKDQCDICVGHETGNLDPETYKDHRLKMELARNEKSMDKSAALDDKCHVLAVDVQGVLLAPMLTASSLYYKTKLVVHNFTVYNLKTRQTTCFLWVETEAELVASVFSTCLRDYLKTHFNDKLPIIIYSDGCTYQNRNAVLSNALLNFAMTTKKEIIQKYLEKGHTQMEVDSVHATIQRKLKGKIINHPYDYIQICSEARSHPQPYDVKYMKHSDFEDFSQERSLRYASVRPGNKTGDPHVNDIRQFQYLPSGTIRFKLDHSGLWSDLPRQPKNICPAYFPRLYKERLPISKRKYKDLQDLLPVLSIENHSFYTSLPQK